ncbi:hypothetical protein BH11BAC2_BH11BAC2_14270 [soil metagenome]
MPKLLKIKEFAGDLERYLDTNLELIKLETTERSSELGSGILSNIIVALTGLLFVIFGSIGLGVYLSMFFGNYFEGFFLIAGFYFVTGVLLWLFRKKWLHQPIRNKIVRLAFSKTDDQV